MELPSKKILIDRAASIALIPASPFCLDEWSVVATVRLRCFTSLKPGNVRVVVDVASRFLKQPR